MPLAARLFRIYWSFKNVGTMERVRIGSERVDLRLTLMDSAQCFAWVEREDCFGAVIAGQPVWLGTDAEGVFAEGGSAALLRDYLDLDRDYGRIAREYAEATSRERQLYRELHTGKGLLKEMETEDKTQTKGEIDGTERREEQEAQRQGDRGLSAENEKITL